MLPHWTQDTIDVGGTSIHYTRTGGDKPPLMLLHGFSDNGLCWLPVALELQSEYDVILPDAVGHGLSQRLQPGQQTDMAADAAGLIRALGLDRPVLGGHSMGGGVAAQVEARFPGLVRGLILEDPVWFDPAPPEPPKKEENEEEPAREPYDQWLARVKEQPIETLMAKCRADNPGWPEVELRPWAESKRQFDPNFLNSEDNQERKWPEVVDYLTVSTLLITAGPEQFSIVSAGTAQRLAETYPNILVAHIANSGHSIRRDNFADYITAVRDFLKSVY
jgi:N-formylmaleamate deformylase